MLLATSSAITANSESATATTAPAASAPEDPCPTFPKPLAVMPVPVRYNKASLMRFRGQCSKDESCGPTDSVSLGGGSVAVSRGGGGSGRGSGERGLAPSTVGVVTRKRPRHCPCKDSSFDLSSSDEDGVEDEVPPLAPAIHDFIFAQRFVCVRKPKGKEYVLNGVCMSLCGRDSSADAVTLRVCDK